MADQDDQNKTNTGPEVTATQGQTPGDLPEQSTARAEAAQDAEAGASKQEVAGSETQAVEGAQAAPVPTPGQGPSRGGGRGGDRGGPGGRGRGGPRGRGRGRESRESEDSVETNVIRIYRCSKVVKGGRTFSFGALVVAGDRSGSIGIGYGKANEVPSAVEKASKEARRSMVKVPMVGKTIPHQIQGRSGASRVTLIPARPGTGVTAGKSVRPLLELAGITDILTKCYGSTSPKNLLKACIDALSRLQSAEVVKQRRGVELPSEAGRLEEVGV